MRMVNHPKCRDPGKLYLSHRTATHSLDRNDGQKDFHWVIFHETQTHTHHEGRNAFLMGYHRTTAKNSLSHQTTPAFSPHYGNSFYRSRPSKASVLACWTLSYSLPVLTSSHFSQLLHLWFTAALCQSPFLSQSATQSFGSVSHGSTLITELQSSFPEWISCCNTQGLQTSVNSSSLATKLSRK